jgi:hypothetical protein
MSKLRLPALAALSAALVLAACGEKKTAALTDFIPADTPYAMVTIEPVPAEVINAYADKFAPLASMYEDMIVRGLKALEAEEDQSALSTRVARALLEEIKGKVSLAGIESLGFSRQTRSALYGIGLVPVARITLRDPAAFQDFIARVEKRVGEALPTATAGDQTYWRLGKAEEKLTGIMAVRGGDLVLSIMPKDASEDLIKRLLGVTLPDQTLAEAGTIEALNEQHGYKPYGSGFVDVVRLTQTLINEKTGIEAEFMRALGAEEPKLSDVCKTEFMSIAQNFPRLVAGYREMTATDLRMDMLLQVKPALATPLSELVAPVPGLGTSSDALMDFGFSVNVQKLIDFAGAQARAFAAAPYQCEHLTELNQGFADFNSQLSNPVLFGLAPVFKGMHASLTQMDLKPSADAATPSSPKIAGKIALASDNPQSLVAMARSFVPQLASLNLEAGAAPTPLPEGLAPPGTPPTFVALADKAVGFSIGAGEEAGLDKYLAAPAGDPPPSFSIGYGGAFFTQIADMTESAGATAMMSDEERAEMEMNMKVVREIYGKVMDRVEFDMLLTADGVRMRQYTRLK